MLPQCVCLYLYPVQHVPCLTFRLHWGQASQAQASNVNVFAGAVVQVVLNQMLINGHESDPILTAINYLRPKDLLYASLWGIAAWTP